MKDFHVCEYLFQWMCLWKMCISYFVIARNEYLIVLLTCNLPVVVYECNVFNFCDNYPWKMIINDMQSGQVLLCINSLWPSDSVWNIVDYFLVIRPDCSGLTGASWKYRITAFILKTKNFSTAIYLCLHNKSLWWVPYICILIFIGWLANVWWIPVCKYGMWLPALANIYIN